MAMNRIAIRVLTLVAAAFVAGGCADMKVNVAILDRNAVGSEPFLEAAAEVGEAKVLKLRSSGRFDRDRADIKVAVLGAYDRVLKGDSGRLIAEEIKTKLRNDVLKDVDDSFNAAGQNYDQGMAKLAELQRTKPSDTSKRKEVAAAAKDAFDRGDQALADLKIKLHTFFVTTLHERGFALPEDQARMLAADVEKKTDAKLDNLIGDAGILDDPMASLVVTAPQEYWRGVFNETYGSGELGNTDIAVVMHSLGNFSLKGVRLDATKTTPAAFAGALMAAKVAAAAAGVPVGPIRSPEAAATQPAVGDDLLNADQTRADAKRKMIRSRLGALAVLNAIVAERAPIHTADPAAPGDADVKKARAAAIDRVKQAYAANKAELEQNP